MVSWVILNQMRNRLLVDIVILMRKWTVVIVLLAAPAIIHAEGGSNSTARAVNSTCEIILLRQQQASELDLAHLGISTNGVSGSSYWFSAPKNITVKEFIAVDNVAIRRQLNKQLKTRGVSGSVRLLIDIEKPVHPKDFSSYRRKHGEEAFKSLIAAFKRRVDIARDLLPDARIGIYGIPTPTSRESDATSLASQISGIQAAADIGLLDSVDDIYPTLYLRYGVGDRDYKSKIARMTRAGIESALTIHRADGSTPGVIPLFSSRIFNGGSKNHKEVAPIELARMQLEIAQSIDGVDAIAYWTAADNEELLHWLEQLHPAPDSCIEPLSPS